MKQNKVVIHRSFFGGETWVEIDPEQTEKQFEELKQAIRDAGSILDFLERPLESE